MQLRCVSLYPTVPLTGRCDLLLTQRPEPLLEYTTYSYDPDPLSTLHLLSSLTPIKNARQCLSMLFNSKYYKRCQLHPLHYYNLSSSLAVYVSAFNADAVADLSERYICERLLLAFHPYRKSPWWAAVPRHAYQNFA